MNLEQGKQKVLELTGQLQAIHKQMLEPNISNAKWKELSDQHYLLQREKKDTQFELIKIFKQSKKRG